VPLVNLAEPRFTQITTASIHGSFLATDEAYILADVMEEDATALQAPGAVPTTTFDRPEDCPLTLRHSCRERRMPWTAFTMIFHAGIPRTIASTLLRAHQPSKIIGIERRVIAQPAGL
jgi:hypothetical protein